MVIPSAPLAANPLLVAGGRIVNDKTILEVGKFYYVKCAIMSNGEREYFIPVIGEAHNDNQFGFKDKHLHIDGRFTTRQNHSELDINKEGLTNHVCSFDPSRSLFTIKEIVIKRLKCKRLTTGINPPNRKKLDWLGRKIKSKYYDWVDTMIGKSCKGKKCPHLGTMMLEKDGMLVCPLHNLKGCLTSEVIVCR